jgi:hypothetical protein
MGTGNTRLGRVVIAGATGILVLLLVGCTGRGGGQLPPAGPAFTGAASFGFSFSCEQSSTSTSPNGPDGRLRIQLSYNERGTWLLGSGLLGSGFTVHGTADIIDPVLESMICIGQNPPPEPTPPNELIFLGTYRAPSPTPAGFASSCPAKATATRPLCRFEVIVRDNDLSRGPSKGDFFSIKLSGSTALTSELDPATVFYARAGLLESGNLKVD